MNKALKMDFKGQTAVLSAFVLVGMIFLVPAITEKALALTFASATGMCGPEGQTHPCEFSLIRKDLSAGVFHADPTGKGTDVSWRTKGTILGGNEQGYVMYQVGGGDSSNCYKGECYNAKFIFSNPGFSERLRGERSTCEVEIFKLSPPFTHDVLQAPGKGPVTGSCHILPTDIATATYTVRSPYNWQAGDQSPLYKHLID